MEKLEVHLRDQEHYLKDPYSKAFRTLPGHPRKGLVAPRESYARLGLSLASRIKQE